VSVRWTERDVARVNAPRRRTTSKAPRSAAPATRGLLDTKTSPSTSYAVVLHIPEVAPSPNKWKGRHWRTYHTLRQLWDVLVVEAIVDLDADYPPVPLKAHVTIHRTGPRLLDPDNLVASCKPILDALRANGLIHDDDPEHLTLAVTQAKGTACTRIEIEARTCE
jgi:hypothetical protein